MTDWRQKVPGTVEKPVSHETAFWYLRPVASSLSVFCTALLLFSTGCQHTIPRVCTPIAPAEKIPDPPSLQVCREVNAPDKRAWLEAPGGSIQVDLDTAEYELDSAVIWKWIGDAVRGVTLYYGRFPVPKSNLIIRPRSGRGAIWGEASGRTAQPTVKIQLGRQTRAEDLAEDWTLTHEIVHLAFPNMVREHLWIEEGLATYVEPLARYKAGVLTEEAVWYEWLHAMHQGQPEAGDAGLDHTPTWGRVYWGGALFSLVADVEIRRVSNNRAGLRDALRGISQAGGSLSVWWKITDAFTIGDRATKTNVLMTEYEKRRAAPAPVDLEDLWSKLGIRIENGRVVFDENAPLAAVRRGIVRD
ncbi:MAG TPA: hypothetical protein PKA58_23510 [Polyangium sp.]|nr:hypothetical protein [Polyangium sp.]